MTWGTFCFGKAELNGRGGVKLTSAIPADPIDLFVVAHLEQALFAGLACACMV